MFNETDEYKYISNMLKGLTSLFGVSSQEENITDFIKEYCKSLVDEIITDNFGNIILKVYAEDINSKTLLLEAHTDRVGFMVSDIESDGKIKFVPIGGIDDRILPFASVKFEKKTASDNTSLYGVIMPCKNDVSEKPLKSDEMFVFTGYSKEELSDIILLGDKFIINPDFIELTDDSLCSGAMDNRAGVSAVLYMLKSLDRRKLKYNLAILFSTEEELGLHGGYTGLTDIKADAAIVVDVTHGKTPDSENQTGVFENGCGAVICRGPNLDYRYTLNLIKLAEKRNIPFEIEVAATSTGTNAWAIQTLGFGTPVMLISIPDKYMHTNVETISVSDIISVSKLLISAAEEGIEIV